MLRSKAELTLVAIAFIWGTTFVVVRSALADASVMAFLAIRFSLGAALLGLIFLPKLRARRPRWRDAAGGLFAGTWLFGGYVLQTAGLLTTTASKSAFLTGLYIVLVPLLGSFVYKCVPRRMELVAAAVGILGTAFMTSTDGLSFRFSTGDWLTIGCAFAFSIHMLSVAHWSSKLSYEWLSLLQVGTVALLSLLTMNVLETPRLTWTPRLAGAILVTAVFATAVSFSLYSWAQRFTTAARAALIFALEPVFAGALSWVALGERWTRYSLTGAGLILLSILLVEMKPQTAKGHPS